MSNNNFFIESAPVLAQVDHAAQPKAPRKRACCGACGLVGHISSNKQCANHPSKVGGRVHDSKFGIGCIAANLTHMLFLGFFTFIFKVCVFIVLCLCHVVPRASYCFASE